MFEINICIHVKQDGSLTCTANSAGEMNHFFHYFFRYDTVEKIQAIQNLRKFYILETLLWNEMLLEELFSMNGMNLSRTQNVINLLQFFSSGYHISRILQKFEEPIFWKLLQHDFIIEKLFWIMRVFSMRKKGRGQKIFWIFRKLGFSNNMENYEQFFINMFTQKNVQIYNSLKNNRRNFKWTIAF